ncbi:MAG: GNAT family N-acetyltransferase [Cytophagaceae bacterium]|nr:GNAT family N-acetyltransferase [Gemmatimonadaceae bacterium]
MPDANRTTAIVRNATSADLPRLGRLGAQLVEAHHDFDKLRFLPTRNRTPADYAAFMVGQLEDPNVILFVADDHGDVIGYSYAAVEGYDYMSLRGPAGVLHDIVVDRQYRRRGVGRLLLAETLTALAKRGAPRVVLETAERNDMAQQLFASMGFRRTMVEMTRELNDEMR